MIKNILLVGIGGATGSILRYGAGLLLNQRFFPYTTFLINITGSFIIGAVIAYSLKNEIFNYHWRLLLTTGFCGGFTTFSAFSLENLQMLQNGKYFLCATYIIFSILLGIGAAWLGYRLFAAENI